MTKKKQLLSQGMAAMLICILIIIAGYLFYTQSKTLNPKEQSINFKDKGYVYTPLIEDMISTVDFPRDCFIICGNQTLKIRFDTPTKYRDLYVQDMDNKFFIEGCSTMTCFRGVI